MVDLAKFSFFSQLLGKFFVTIIMNILMQAPLQTLIYKFIDFDYFEWYLNSRHLVKDEYFFLANHDRFVYWRPLILFSKRFKIFRIVKVTAILRYEKNFKNAKNAFLLIIKLMLLISLNVFFSKIFRKNSSLLVRQHLIFLIHFFSFFCSVSGISFL